MGSGLGTVASWSLTAVLVEAYGWPSAFYVMGGIMALFTVFWWFAVYDSPADHPRSPDERQFIEDRLVHSSGKRVRN